MLNVVVFMISRVCVCGADKEHCSIFFLYVTLIEQGRALLANYKGLVINVVIPLQLSSFALLVLNLHSVLYATPTHKRASGKDDICAFLCLHIYSICLFLFPTAVKVYSSLHVYTVTVLVKPFFRKKRTYYFLKIINKN